MAGSRHRSPSEARPAQRSGSGTRGRTPRNRFARHGVRSSACRCPFARGSGDPVILRSAGRLVHAALMTRSRATPCCTAVSSALKNRERSALVSAAGPRVFIPSSRRWRDSSRPASAPPILASVHTRPLGATTRASLARQRAASGTSEVTHTSRAPIRSAIQSSAASDRVADQDHPDVGQARRQQRARAVGDDKDREPEPGRDPVDLLAHRAGIAIDVE